MHGNDDSTASQSTTTSPVDTRDIRHMPNAPNPGLQPGAGGETRLVVQTAGEQHKRLAISTGTVSLHTFDSEAADDVV
ncbi:MAG: hypothetical protein RL594_4 [Bacteroidota bacterium]|jgi:hypothetical protein